MRGPHLSLLQVDVLLALAGGGCLTPHRGGYCTDGGARFFLGSTVDPLIKANIIHGQSGAQPHALTETGKELAAFAIVLRSQASAKRGAA